MENKLVINKKEVLRYLEVSRLDEKLDEIVSECINELQELITPKIIIKYSKINIEKHVNLIDLNLTLEGNDIRNHLKNAEGCFVLAATLGIKIDKKILYYEKIDMTKAIILNACATAAIEEFCDKKDDEIKNMIKKQGKSTTWRYSPGYGDLGIDIQPNILKSLDAEKIIGLTATSHNILIPRKSVTAFIGIVPKENEVKKRGCLDCNKFEECKFRKSGKSCGD